MDCFFKDPRLLKQQQQQKQTTTQQQQQQQQIRIKTLQSNQQPLPKRIKLNHQQQTATGTNQTTTTTKKSIHSKPQLNNTQQSDQLSKTRETKPLVNQTEDNHHKTQEINNNNTTQDINQTQDINKTQDIKKNQNNNTTQNNFNTQDKQPQDDQNQTNKNPTTNHQDYQLHPIIPRSVDKTITAYSSNHPLNVEPAERKLTSSAKLVNANRNQFKPWFTNQDPQRWPFKKNQDPKIRVVYPTGAHELFPLLVPKNDLDEYRPLDDLLNVITTTLTYYLTPDQSLHFFSEPHPITSPSASVPHSQLNDFSFLNRRSQERSSPEPGRSTTPKIPLSDASLDLSSKPLLKELVKTIRRKNGPEFLGLVGWYNRVIKYLVEGKEIGRQIGSFVGMPQGVWETILGQAYDRQVGPQLELLQGYETWSSNVYGELKPRFVSEIIRLVGLRPGMVFLDLGSGIGNIVLQVALEVGCVAVGFEIMDGCAKLANLQRSELVGRAHSLWGVNLGAPLLFQADFTKDPRVGQWLQQADVVLVNNQVFTPSLNESLSLLFLELKDTAQIVSLKPFISSSFKLNQRNLDSPLAILSRPALRPTPPSTLVANSPGVFSYPSNSVSWTDNPGDFFVSVVNRDKLIRFQESCQA
ncbi:Nucleosomal histone H3-Lys79 methylase [Puccinia graminis f. sp. tritici]|uniref:Histone-lysine N-methyltransferase, H3 lysine-79 specific n=1 Tax=Puccinia graminis f. sp. tritici TaxID=56615 RepID=A0A5B0RG95_PUCGR|nr:Nucleosomal histone H3-Lys79 methylase [Puccinia graminis f. sp. tritici]KAA1124911.1 Nucleosomal histone H3-Lys79 methylase [Puccinia graminis f. sp. tritici]